MLTHFLTGFALLLAYFVVFGAPVILLKVVTHAPRELMRKLYHLLFVLSIVPLLLVFDTWYAAALAALLFALLVYVALALLEHTAFFRRVAIERNPGEFKRSLVLAELSIALLIFLFWGLLGADWKFIVLVAVMAWGFGDAAAALVGKAFGRNQIAHPKIEGSKTVEGTMAMLVVAAIAIFLTMLLVGQPLLTSLAVAVLVAPVGALVELFSHRGFDTLTVPLSVGLSVLLLLAIFSFAGL